MIVSSAIHIYLTLYEFDASMAIPNKSSQVNIRLTPDTVSRISVLVDSGEFDNISAFVRYAIHNTLNKYRGRIPPES